MKHFILEMTYTVSLDELEPHVADHRAYLQLGYDRGLLLMSGPQEPRIGGLAIARAASRAEIEAFFAEDPFQRRGLATYRFIEFNPVKLQASMRDWVEGKAVS